MKITQTKLPGVVLIEPTLFSDDRGYFFESFNHKRYQEIVAPHEFVQDNYSASHQHVLRGLHYQLPHTQGKLIYVLSGAVIDVAVDIRRGSPTFGQHVCVELNGEKHQQLYIPPGFAHGFCTLTDKVSFVYKCTDFYHPEAEKGIHWNDPALNINWPTQTPLVADRDNAFPLLCDVPEQDLPTMASS